MKDYYDFVRKNQEILDRWKAKFPLEKQGKFADDGIMNKGETELGHDGRVWRKSGNENELWNKAPLRVLFLTKDENLYDDDIPVWDVRTETFHQKGIDCKLNVVSNSTFYRNEANILYGILNTRVDNMIGFHEFSREDALKFSDKVVFARINCKKEGGGGTITDGELQNAIEEYFDDLKDQILAIDADIIICCGHQHENNVILNALYKIYSEDFQYINLGKGKGTGVHYNEAKNKLAIDAYHLAYLNGGEELRYYEIVGAYYEFVKHHPYFIESHRGKSNLKQILK